MSSSKQQLIDLIDSIISQELNETEKQSYQLEGEEIIQKILKAENTDVITQKTLGARNFDFGISPTDLTDIIKETVTFGGVIVSIFNLYFEFKKINKSKKQSDLESWELKEKVYSAIMKQDLPEPLKEKLNKKYERQLLEIFEQLD